MLRQPKQQPVAVCTVCGAYGYSVQHIGERCGKPDGGRRCAGVRARATSPENWKCCPACDGTGLAEDRECTACWGRGWRYLRPAVKVPLAE